MAFIEQPPKPEKLKIDLQGPEGNAFVLLAYAHRIGNVMGLTDKEIKDITKEMRSGDYQNLLMVFDKNFGAHVDLLLPPNWTWTDPSEKAPVSDDMVPLVIEVEGDDKPVVMPRPSRSLR